MDQLPEPLVPSDVDLRDFQYMELDVRVLRDSRFAAQVSGDAFRAGVLLWCAAWHQVPCGSLPDDDIELANLAGYGRFVKEWRKVRDEALTKFVKCSDGRLYHAEVAAKAASAWRAKLAHHYSRACDRLRKKNRQRSTENLPTLPELSFDAWNELRSSSGIPMEKAEASGGIPKNAPQPAAGIPPESPLKGNGEGTERERNGEGTDCVVGAAAPLPSTAKAAPTPRGNRLPTDWALPKAWGDWAIAEYPQWTPEKVRREAAAFGDHWRAKAGKDATKLDWEATWRNWCRSDIAHRDDARPSRGRAPPAPIDTEARNAEARRLLGFDPTPAPQTHEVIDVPSRLC